MRLSDTPEVQLAFRKAVQRVWEQVVLDVPLPPFLTGTIHGDRVLQGIVETEDSLKTLGFGPEHIRMLKSLCTLLRDCSRIRAGPEILGVVEVLFRPASPVTTVSAEAFEQVVAEFIQSIASARKGWRRWLT